MWHASECEQPLLSREEGFGMRDGAVDRFPSAADAPSICADNLQSFGQPSAGQQADVNLRELHLRPQRNATNGGNSSATSSSDEPESEGVSASASVISLLLPVTVTIVLTTFLVQSLAESPQKMAGGFSQLMVYHEHSDDTASTIASGVLMNSLMMVGTLFCVTTLLLVLYKLRCYVVIYGWLLLSVGSLLLFFGGFVADQFVKIYEVQLDWPTGYFLMYNFAAVGTLMIFWTELGCGSNPPRVLQQSYLVVISALLAWSATKLPEWSTWGVLAAVALWDIVAVLMPKGPLKMLVEEAERRQEPIPGLVYEGADIKLGLGDFVFYSALVGRASMSSVSAGTACTLAVLTGLCATLALLPILQRVLPALPISIAVGIGFYFISTLFLTPTVNFISSEQLSL